MSGARRCPTCGDVQSVRYENIGRCKDSSELTALLTRALAELKRIIADDGGEYPLYKLVDDIEAVLK